MNTPLALLAVTAVAGLFVMAFVGLNSEITGQVIDISRVTPEMIKKVQKGIEEKEKYVPPPAEPICDCPNYGDSILTSKQQFLEGLSKWDCELIKEIIKLKKELKKSTKDLDQWKNFCDMYWPDY
jgi:hypothetical protein